MSMNIEQAHYVLFTAFSMPFKPLKMIHAKLSMN